MGDAEKEKIPVCPISMDAEEENADWLHGRNRKSVSAFKGSSKILSNDELGIGTSGVGYCSPDMGPFKCSNCVHSALGGRRCCHSEVVVDLGPASDSERWTKTEPESCCNYFRPGKKQL